MSDTPHRALPDPDARQLMIVDDEPELLQSLIALFEKQYMVIFAPSGSKAIELLEQGFTPQVILSDNRMPGISGIEFLAKSHDYVPDAVRVIMTGFTDIRDILAAINQGHVYMYMTKPWQVADLLQAIRICFQHYHVTTSHKRLLEEMQQKNELMHKLNDELFATNKKLADVNHEVYGDLLDTTRTLGSLIGAHQHFFYRNHAEGCAMLAEHLGTALGFTGDKLSHLVIAALLHDIGMVGLPNTILGQSLDKLTGSDKEIYETHVERGAALLRPIERLHKVADIVEQHHERTDGSGFPRHLSGYQVMREAQIVGLVAIYHDLVYRVDSTLYFQSPVDHVFVQTEAELAKRQAEASQVLKNYASKFDHDIFQAFFDLAKAETCPGLRLP
jgi:putative nucleotidyltransferase with HDIG domain